jgi:hypothetical protein
VRLLLVLREITRAMTKLIVIGPDIRAITDISVHDNETLRQWIALYRDMIGQCQRMTL